METDHRIGRWYWYSGSLHKHGQLNLLPTP